MKNLRTSSLEKFFEVITAFYFKSQQNMGYILSIKSDMIYKNWVFYVVNDGY